MARKDKLLRYSIFDPTGNITALVESPVPVAGQPRVAAEIMTLHQAVEQVGFVSRSDVDGVDLELRMAGGEFCGNASLSAAALFCLHEGDRPVVLQVSGAERPVAVTLRREGDGFLGCMVMPRAAGIQCETFAFGSVQAELPLVRSKGISHLVIEPSSPFYALLNRREDAEGAVKRWCEQLGADGLGLMFLSGEKDAWHLTPLVYVPGSDTVFWENSCASGSAAVGMLLASRHSETVELALEEPGGTLRVKSDPISGETWLFGHTKRIFET